MMTGNTSQTNSSGNIFFDTGVGLKIYHVEGENDAEVACNELLDLVDKYEKRSQLNIELPLEANLGKSLSP